MPGSIVIRQPTHGPLTTDGRDGMSQVVLAVAERALAVFPRLAPMNGRERNEKCVRRETGSSESGEIPRCGLEDRAPLEGVPIGRVVPDAGVSPKSSIGAPDAGSQGTRDNVSLGWMKVAA